MSCGKLTSFGESTAVWVSKVRGFCAAVCQNDIDAARVCLLRGNINGGGGSVKLSFSFLQQPKPDSVTNVCGVSNSGVRKV